MALARIFSGSPEQAASLIQELERQGYKVEVFRPDEAPAGEADLEIQYELCDSHRAVERANQLATELQADVAVEAGALPIAPVQPLREEFAEALAGKQDPEIEKAEEAPVARLNEIEAGQEEKVEQGAGGLEEVTIAQEAVRAEEDRLKVDGSVIEVSAAEPSGERGLAATTWSRGMAALVAYIGNSLHTLHLVWLAGLHRMREQRARAAIHEAQARARREEHLLELTCRRAEALQQSRQLAAARRAAAGYLSQLQRESGAPANGESRSADERPPIPSRKTRYLNSWWTPSQHMKRIAAGAAAAGALFALTLGISALRSRPSPAKAAEPTATVPAATVTVESNSVVSRAIPARPSAAVHQNRNRSHHSRTAHVSRSRSLDDADTADDVVVRHFAPAKSLQSRSRGSDGVKRYSDDN